MKWLIVLLVALCFAACSDDTEEKDVGPDSTIQDFAAEAIVDAAEEASPDTSVDAEEDITADVTTNDQGDDQ